MIGLKKSISILNKSLNNDMNFNIQDDFGNKIAGLQNLIEIFVDLKKKNMIHSDEFTYFLKQLDVNLKSLEEDMKDFFWAHSDDNQVLFEVISKFEDFVALHNHYSNSNIILEVQLDQNYQLPYLWNRQFYLILKETLVCLSNTIKKNSITIKIKVENTLIEALFIRKQFINNNETFDQCLAKTVKKVNLINGATITSQIKKTQISVLFSAVLTIPKVNDSLNKKKS